MKLQVNLENNQSLSEVVFSKLRRMLSPSVGICQEIGYMGRSSLDPFLITIGAELTGVHHVLNRANPGKGGYHIGGVGFYHNEAMIKTLSESLERYSQLLSEFQIKDTLPREFLSYEEIQKRFPNVLNKKFLQLFEKKQFETAGFPYDPFDPNKPLTWIEISAINQKKKTWIPAQLLFIGYTCMRPKEPWLSTAVTTGTASHRTREKAVLGAISELIQIDAAMGHWYTDTQAIALELDHRVEHFKAFKEKVMRTGATIQPTFYLLESKGFPGFNVACVFERKSPHIPRFAVGLGSSCSLEKALYQAFLEGYGVVGLARLNIYKEKYMDSKPNKNKEKIYDLDSNVASYAVGNHENFIRAKFNANFVVKTSELSPDWTFEHDIEMVNFFIKVFEDNHKDLFYVDLTSPEAKQLGFHIARVWSPDLLPLCLPSAVQKNHPRFQDYKGVSHEFPHPYP